VVFGKSFRALLKKKELWRKMEELNPNEKKILYECFGFWIEGWLHRNFGG
jgi:hypothetical protein